ncbi:hypothetical protein F2Q70_00015224 [Brassica cretica]|uniref:Uncharacterized protein n=1 Tax=Brassica cretica TaxID=69181 RepID=A0A8S9HZA5_BRACR|nr:hypothetical protein F2Q70_00015224 [Brassica cretica]
MGQLVKLVVGVWEHLGSNDWLFMADPTEQRHEVMVHENQTYPSLVELARMRYSVGSHTAVALTYEYPEWMKVPGDLTTPPGDVEFFMSVRLDIPEMRLKVTIGNDNVARYLFQRRDDFTVIGSYAGNLAPNPIPYRGRDNINPPVEEHMNNLPEVFWEGMLAQG